MNINNMQNKKMFNPFPGLRPFGIKESHLFFGREGQSEEVLNNLSRNRFVAVVGSSGSGKSSLMYCGLVPVLQGGFITEAGSKWRVIVSRPGNDPIGNLAEAIASQNKLHKSIDKTVTRSILESSSLGLIEAISQLDREKDENILLLADQFEELFRFKRKFDNVDSANESYAYIKLLLEAIKQTKVPIYIIMTMRSDFIGECAQYQELTEAINSSHYLIPQMTRDNLRSAITGPISVGGGVISDKLINQLLNDVGDNPDQLPILQHALMRTWNYWTINRKANEELDIVHYEAVGRMDTALSNHANEAYDELTLDEKQICENLFKTLTEKGADNRGIRHPSSIVEIAAIAKTSEEKVINIIEKFRFAGRSFLTSSDKKLSGNSIIDISHESLMRIWDKLKVWVEEESLAVQMYIRLSGAAALYQSGKIGLWRPPDLHLALNWRKEKQPTLTWAQRFAPAFERTMVYLETSEKEHIADEQNKLRLQKKAIRRSRIFAIVLGTAAIISLGFMVYAIMMQNDANKQKVLAQEQTIKAEEQTEIANEQTDEAKKQKQRAEKQRKLALEKQKEALTEKERAELERQRAENSAYEAQKQTKIANQKSEEAARERKIAEEKSQEALIQKNKAEEATENTYKLRMLSIARSMSIKSVQIEDDEDKKSLLAYQAYVFNKRHKGQEYDPDIYDGLYYSLKEKSEKDFDRYKGHDNAVRSISFSPDSKILYSAGSDGKVLEWNMSNGLKKAKEIYKCNTIIRSISQSNNLIWLVCATENSELILIDLITKNKKKLENVHNGIITAVAFSNDSKYFVSVGLDGVLNMWNPGTYEKVELVKLNSPIKSVAISPDSKIIACATEKGELILCDIESNKTKTIYKSSYPLNVVAYNSNNSLLAFGDNSGEIYLWDLNKSELKQKLKAHSARINDIKFSNDDKLLATASFDGATKVWQTANYHLEPLVLKDHESWVLSIAFTDDNSELVTACVDSDIKKWDISSRTLATKLSEKLIRNMSENEWKIYVGKDIPYEETIKNKP